MATSGDAAIQATACFAAGTGNSTTRGDVAVEDLRIGDLIPTVLGESAERIIRIGRRYIECTPIRSCRRITRRSSAKC